MCLRGLLQSREAKGDVDSMLALHVMQFLESF